MSRLPKDIIRKYGITKKAWAVFRGEKPSTERSKNMPRRKGTRAARVSRAAKRVGRRSKGGLMKAAGHLSFKSIIGGVAGLEIMERFNPLMAGTPYKPAIDKIAVGIVSPMVGFPSPDMLSVGVKEGLKVLVDGYLFGSSTGNGGDML